MTGTDEMYRERYASLRARVTEYLAALDVRDGLDPMDPCWEGAVTMVTETILARRESLRAEVQK